MTAEELRRVSGGVIGHFTPKECVIDLAADTLKGAVGSNSIGLKVPANKFIVGAYLKNIDNALAGTGATIGITVGSDAVLTGAAFADVKGKGVAALDATPDFAAAEREVKLTVATAAYTAGKLIVGVIYG